MKSAVVRQRQSSGELPENLRTAGKEGTRMSHSGSVRAQGPLRRSTAVQMIPY